MALEADVKKAIIEEYATHPGDTGSPEVQVAMLTQRIKDLTEHLKTYGYSHDEKELPDYLPLLLEFVSELGEDESKVFLGDAGKVLKVIAANLEKSGSHYAQLIRIVDNHGSLVKLAA